MYGYIIHVEGEGGQTSINCFLKGLDITLEPVTTYLTPYPSNMGGGGGVYDIRALEFVLIHEDE